MKKNYRFDTTLRKIKLSLEVDFASATRMLLVLGEDELEIKSQGRFDSNDSFSQETGAIGQQTPRTGEQRPMLARELSAGMRLNSGSTPHFFSPQSERDGR